MRVMRWSSAHSCECAGCGNPSRVRTTGNQCGTRDTLRDKAASRDKKGPDGLAVRAFSSVRLAVAMTCQPLAGGSNTSPSGRIRCPVAIRMRAKVNADAVDQSYAARRGSSMSRRREASSRAWSEKDLQLPGVEGCIFLSLQVLSLVYPGGWDCGSEIPSWRAGKSASMVVMIRKHVVSFFAQKGDVARPDAVIGSKNMTVDCRCRFMPGSLTGRVIRPSFEGTKKPGLEDQPGPDERGDLAG